MPSKDYKKDNFIVRIFKSQIFFSLLALVLLVMILIPVYKNWQDRRAIDREIAEIEKKMKEYENSNEELIEMFDYLESDESALKQARINFNYKKPGEEVVVIKTETEEQDNIVNNTNNIKEELSNPKIWFRYFFN